MLCPIAASLPHVHHMKPQSQDGDGPTAMQLDAYVDVERLAEAMSELDKYIEAARAQLFEIRKKKAGECCLCAAVLVRADFRTSRMNHVCQCSLYIIYIILMISILNLRESRM